jgi:two-component system, sporulation sensor kinase D
LNLLREITGFDLSARKQRWKLLLLLFAAMIVAASLYYTDILVKKLTLDERQKVELWADAVQKRASLVKYTEEFFENIREEERKRVELQAKVHRRLNYAESSGELNFIIEVLGSNTTIPVLLVDEDGVVYNSMNLDERFRGQRRLEGELWEYFSDYPPIPFAVGRTTQYIYYRDSKLFTDLKDVLDDLVDSFISDIVVSSANIPVLVVDSTRQQLIDYGNINDLDRDDPRAVASLIQSMSEKNPPITIELPTYGKAYVYYTNSFLVTQLRYYPIAQLMVIGIFLLVSYVLFSLARNAEQNMVWVGMSKETAHQLGTPLSSLMGWVELLKAKGVDDETIREIQKDLNRLEDITERFSKIGSAPSLVEQDLVGSVQEIIKYMKMRTSNKVHMVVVSSDSRIMVPFNANLFGWVIENIIKNAVDAMDGKGDIALELSDGEKQVILDISDTGKGIPPSKFRAIFKTGYTSKKRGWGLGLSLSKRIIESYHNGKLFVKESAPGRGTTFRIILRK